MCSSCSIHTLRCWRITGARPTFPLLGLGGRRPVNPNSLGVSVGGCHTPSPHPRYPTDAGPPIPYIRQDEGNHGIRALTRDCWCVRACVSACGAAFPGAEKWGVQLPNMLLVGTLREPGSSGRSRELRRCLPPNVAIHFPVAPRHCVIGQ